MDATKMATTAALAEMESPIKYSQLEEIEDQFEDVELKIIRQQDELTRDLYTKRQKIVSQIPGFWPLVFEQAPADIDEFVTPDDSNILLNALDDLFVERFELPGGDPRSLLIRFTFKENEWFENKTLEKKFWWRHAKDGWAGYVSEPVEIQWKSAEKDATHGVLSLAKKLFEEDKAGKGKEDTETKKEYKKLIEGTGYAGVSFFSWFGFRGRKISEEENVEAKKIEEEKRAKRAAGQDEEDDDDMEEDEEDEDEDEYEFEIFPTGDDLAVAIAEDLWPSAIKMFTDAQEAEMIGELGLDDDDEDSDDDEDEEMGDDETPNKKRKA